MGRRWITLVAIFVFSTACGWRGSGLLHLYQPLPRVVDARPLTHDPANDYLPAWSPDGHQIAFVSYRSGNEEIWLMDSDGQNLKPLTADPRGDWSPTWSPDGRRITFTSDRTGTNQIWIMNRDGSVDGWRVSWSPDGQKIAYTKQIATGRSTYQTDLWMITLKRS